MKLLLRFLAFLTIHKMKWIYVFIDTVVVMAQKTNYNIKEIVFTYFIFFQNIYLEKRKRL